MKYLCYFLLFIPISVHGSTTKQYGTTTTNLLDQGTVTQSSGVVISPGYPGNYPANQEKKVSIYVPLHSSVEIKFHHFDMQDCYDCNCDFLSITSFSRFCGSSMPSDLHMGNNMQKYLEFRFHSDATTERSGFYLTYNIFMPASTTVPSPSQAPSHFPCPSTDCDYCSPDNRRFRMDAYGCMVCECMAMTPGTSRPGSSSLLLSILSNLETEAEAMELQAKSVKDSANLAINLLQHGQVRRK